MKGHNPISVAHVHLNHPSIETKMVHRCQASLLSPTHSQYKLCRVPGGARDMQTAPPLGNQLPPSEQAGYQ